MNGWEATAQAGQAQFADWNLYKNNLMDQVAADGINRIRLEVPIFTENVDNTRAAVNDNADPFSINWAGFYFNEIDANAEIITMLKSRLAARGETVWVNLCYVDFRDFSFEHNTNPEEYAELMEATFIHLNATFGWVPDSVEAILEPDGTGNQNTGHPWTAAQIAACVVATQNRLASHGWHPRFVLPSVMRCPDAVTWYNNVKSANPAALTNVDELNYHWYQPCTASDLQNNKNVAEADGKHLAMLEWIGADYTRLHEDLKYGAVAWSQMSVAWDNSGPGDNGAKYYLIDTTNHTASIASRTKLLRQYFKWIRRGAVRKGTSTTNPNFDALAFRNTGGNYTVVVNCLTGGSFSIGGLPPATYHITYSTADLYNQSASDQTITAGQNISTSIPAAGALTVYADPTVDTNASGNISKQQDDAHATVTVPMMIRR
jgi:hypothetical protein